MYIKEKLIKFTRENCVPLYDENEILILKYQIWGII